MPLFSGCLMIVLNGFEKSQPDIPGSLEPQSLCTTPISPDSIQVQLPSRENVQKRRR